MREGEGKGACFQSALRPKRSGIMIMVQSELHIEINLWPGGRNEIFFFFFLAFADRRHFGEDIHDSATTIPHLVPSHKTHTYTHTYSVLYGDSLLLLHIFDSFVQLR